MICPQCRVEYREEITQCADCQIPLVDSSALENDADAAESEVKLLPVISTSNFGDIALIKSLLDAEGIAYFVDGENFNTVSPWIQPVRFLVREDSFEKAREVLSNFDVHAIGPSTSVDDEEEPRAD